MLCARDAALNKTAAIPTPTEFKVQLEMPTIKQAITKHYVRYSEEVELRVLHQ